jgi:hypothetical protein
MDKDLQELLDFINHPDFVEPPKYAPKTLENWDEILAAHEAKKRCLASRQKAV